MAHLIAAPIVIASPGTPPKQIAEYVGRVSTGQHRRLGGGDGEPDRLVGARSAPRVRRVHGRAVGRAHASRPSRGRFRWPSGQAVHAPAGEWVRYSTPKRAGPTTCRSACRPSRPTPSIGTRRRTRERPPGVTRPGETRSELGQGVDADRGEIEVPHRFGAAAPTAGSIQSQRDIDHRRPANTEPARGALLASNRRSASHSPGG